MSQSVLVEFEIGPPQALLQPPSTYQGARRGVDAVAMAAAEQAQQEVAQRLSLLHTNKELRGLLMTNLYDEQGVVDLESLNVGELRGIEIFDPETEAAAAELSESDAGVFSIESKSAPAADALALSAERFVPVALPQRANRSQRFEPPEPVTIRVLFDDGFGATVDATPSTTIGSIKARAAHVYYARLHKTYGGRADASERAAGVPSTFFRHGRPRGELIILVADGRELTNSDTVTDAQLTARSLCVFMVRATLSSVFNTWCDQITTHLERTAGASFGNHLDNTPRRLLPPTRPRQARARVATRFEELCLLDKRVLAHEGAIRDRHRTMGGVRAEERRFAELGKYAEAKQSATRVRRLAGEIEELCELRWSREHSAHLRRRELYVGSLQTIQQIQVSLHEIHATVSKVSERNAAADTAAMQCLTKLVNELRSDNGALVQHHLHALRQQQEVVAESLLDAEDREDYVAAERAQQEVVRLESIVQVRERERARDGGGSAARNVPATQLFLFFLYYLLLLLPSSAAPRGVFVRRSARRGQALRAAWGGDGHCGGDPAQRARPVCRDADVRCVPAHRREAAAAVVDAARGARREAGPAADAARSNKIQFRGAAEKLQQRAPANS